MHKPLTREYLRELLHYDPTTGLFVWKIHRSGRAKIGDVAGELLCGRYYVITIDGVKHPADGLARIYNEGDPPRSRRGHDAVMAVKRVAQANSQS